MLSSNRKLDSTAPNSPSRPF